MSTKRATAKRAATKRKKKTTAKARAATAKAPTKARERDPRLPNGGAITKTYKGKPIRVTHDADGFHYDGRVWRSLTAIAKAVTGYKTISGPAFFGVAKQTEKGGA